MGGCNTASVVVAAQGHMHSCAEPCPEQQTHQTGPVQI